MASKEAFDVMHIDEVEAHLDRLAATPPSLQAAE